jgi:hypothetical protein
MRSAEHPLVRRPRRASFPRVRSGPAIWLARSAASVLSGSSHRHAQAASGPGPQRCLCASQACRSDLARAVRRASRAGCQRRSLSDRNRQGGHAGNPASRRGQITAWGEHVGSLRSPTSPAAVGGATHHPPVTWGGRRGTSGASDESASGPGLTWWSRGLSRRPVRAHRGLAGPVRAIHQPRASAHRQRSWIRSSRPGPPSRPPSRSRHRPVRSRRLQR